MSRKAVRETLGLVAVVAGLVFVGVEIRQNTVASRAAAYQALGVAMAETWADMTHDRQLSDMITGGIEGSFTNWSPGDWAQAANLWTTWLTLTETALIQVEQGVLPPEAMERLGFVGSRGQWLTQNKVFACLWPHIRVGAGTSLRAYIEDGADPPDCSDMAIPAWLLGG